MELLQDTIQALARNGYAHPERGRNAITLSEAEDQTIADIREYARHLFRAAGKGKNEWAIRDDAFGNIAITLRGKEEIQVMTGSHVDSVKDGGAYDGITGVAAGLHFLEKLVRSGQTPKYDFTVIGFRAEESSPATGTACLGSQIATGLIQPSALEAIRYKAGKNGEEYSLQQQIENRYDKGRWDRILQQVTERPFIHAKNTKLFEEMHIEQSCMLARVGADVGIVDGGIGGQRRSTIKVPAEALRTETMEVTPENPHVRLKIDIHGHADHTGGTPMNGTMHDRNGTAIRFRADALLGSAEIVAALARQIPSVKILRIDIPSLTGFTTVPAIQTLECALALHHRSHCEHILRKLQRMCLLQGLRMHCTITDISAGSHLPYLPPHYAKHLLGIPTAVEDATRSVILQHEGSSNAPGNVRGTVTDFVLHPLEGFQCNIDQRHVEHEQAKLLNRKIEGAIATRLWLSSIDATEAYNAKPFAWSAPVDAASTAAKKRIAQTLALQAQQMASMPGHDAAKLSLAGIPVTMTFVRHDGISHHPEESASEEDLQKAAALSHAFLAEVLEVKMKT